MTNTVQAFITELAVRPEWIDFNGHMNGGYYTVAFDIASVNFLHSLGIDNAYRAKTKNSTFALEAHICYLQELHKDQKFTIHSYLFDADNKRLHFYHEIHIESGEQQIETIVASLEVVTMHVNLKTKRSAIFPQDIAETINNTLVNHKAFSYPELLGRSVGIRHAKTTGETN